MQCTQCGQKVPTSRRSTKTQKLIEKIIKAITDETDVPGSAIQGDSRQPRAVALRYMAIVLAHNHSGAGPSEVGKVMNRARATVWAALKRHPGYMSHSTEYATLFHLITEKLK